ncbi:MAG: chromosome segregation protein SMC, partial [Aestuariivirgaceae bacterium]|nr:chromosome segregation protein SMC [Aestuariivirgaceae bacterium]
LLFADASTGARSPALVRQGQIGELINAKPQSRRRILEEAAGITGLHTRRHEAELKLKGAETNLQRLDDVVAQLDTQLGSLKRQSRQAQKYKQISTDVKRLEAAQLYMSWQDAAEAVKREQLQLDEITRFLAEATRVLSEKTRERDAAAEHLPKLRENETVRAAVLQRLTLERQSLEAEEARAKARKAEIEARLKQSEQDLAREEETLADTAQILEKLSAEEAELMASQGQDQALRAESAVTLQTAAAQLAQTQEEADEANARLSELTARRNAIARGIEDQRGRLSRLERELADVQARKAALIAEAGGEE